MLRYVHGANYPRIKHKRNRRRLSRLFAAACCQRLLPIISEDWARHDVSLAQYLADSLEFNDQRRKSFESARRRFRDVWTLAPAEQEVASSATSAIYWLLLTERRFDEAIAAESAHDAARAVHRSARNDFYSEQRAQSTALRDIFGNPFRPVVIDPRWLTSTVVDLATAIYEERAFERVPIFADALTDAGCSNKEIIAHCKSAGPHVRGCWAVDKLLGKE